MKMIILIKAARTDWDDQDRLIGDTSLPINAAGRAEAKQVATELAMAAPKAMYCGSDSPSEETAEILAAARGLKLKTLEDLRELDVGLWEGMTNEQFKERFPKVFKVWREEPGAVEPPDGEGLEAAEARLREAIRKILRRKIGSPVAIVVGRLAFACLRSRILDGDFGRFWTHAEEAPPWCEIDEATVGRYFGVTEKS